MPTATPMPTASPTPPNPDPNHSFLTPNEPAGWVTRGYNDLFATGVTRNGDYFNLDGNEIGGRARPFPEGGIPEIGVDPQEGNFFRAVYPEGMEGGRDAATLVPRFSGATRGGVYYAYTFRLSENWYTRPHEMLGIKHVIPFIITTNGGPASDLGWTNIANVPDSEEYRMGFAIH